MKAYGKLIKLMFHVPCWQRRCLYLLHSSFWSRLPLPTCVLVLCWAKSPSFLLGKRRANKKHLLGLSQPVVLPSAFSLLLADSFFLPPHPPQVDFTINQTHQLEIWFIFYSAFSRGWIKMYQCSFLSVFLVLIITMWANDCNCIGTICMDEPDRLACTYCLAWPNLWYIWHVFSEKDLEFCNRHCLSNEILPAWSASPGRQDQARWSERTTPRRQRGDADLSSSWIFHCQEVQPHWHKESVITEAETLSSQRPACSPWCQNQLWVSVRVRWTGLDCLPRLSHLQLSTSTEERSWQSPRLARMAWQSTHACRFSLPEAVRFTWRQIKHAWCPATAANMPGQERQRERSPTEALFGSRLESGCYRERSKSCGEPAASFFLFFLFIMTHSLYVNSLIWIRKCHPVGI